MLFLLHLEVHKFTHHFPFTVTGWPCPYSPPEKVTRRPTSKPTMSPTDTPITIAPVVSESPTTKPTNAPIQKTDEPTMNGTEANIYNNDTIQLEVVEVEGGETSSAVTMSPWKVVYRSYRCGIVAAVLVLLGW